MSLDKLLERENIKSIIESTAKNWNISVYDLLNSRGQKNLILPHNTAVYLLRKELKLSFPKIAEIMRQDCSTVIFAYGKMESKSFLMIPPKKDYNKFMHIFLRILVSVVSSIIVTAGMRYGLFVSSRGGDCIVQSANDGCYGLLSVFRGTVFELTILGIFFILFTIVIYRSLKEINL